MRSLATAFLLIFSHFTLADAQVFTRVVSDTYSEPTSIDSFTHKFYGPVQSGDHAFTLNQAEVGVKYGHLSFSLIGRFDYLFKFTPDTARFYHDIENGHEPTGDAEYALQLEVSHLQASGIRLNYDWQLTNDLQVSFAVSGLKSSGFYEGNLWGTALWQNEDNYQIDANVLLYSHQDILLEYPMEAASGWGYTFDMALNWQLQPKLRASLQVTDLLSRIHWRDALLSELDLSSNVRRYDSDGEFHVRPLLQGRQVTLDYQQRLPRKWRTSLAYQLTERNEIYLTQRHNDYFSHTRLGLRYALAPQHQLELFANLQAKALGFGYQTPFMHIALATDQLSTTRAHALNLQMGVALPF